MNFIGVLGLAVLLTIAWIFSTDRSKIQPRIIIWGLILQLVLAILVMRTPAARALDWFSDKVTLALEKADAGALFLFGPLANQETLLGNQDALGFIFAFKVLPTIIYISSFFSVLYYLGILQKLVLFMAKIMVRTMGTSGAESLSTAANVFMGQTEAPLVVMPYIPKMTHSELCTLMVGGMATISGGVMAAYISMGIEANFLLAASVMNAPAAILISKMLVPETGTPLTRGEVKLEVERTEVNIIDAAARGAGAGLHLALNVGAMLIAFLSLVALVNWPLQSVGLSLEQILAWIFAPLAFVMGVPWADAGHVGTLFGEKLILNEFVAYAHLVELKADDVLTGRSELIATYALCGFANLGSIGIQLGGIGGIAPTRKQDLAKLGLRVVLGGSLATFMTATIAGLLNP